MEKLIAKKQYKAAWDLITEEIERDIESKEDLKELFLFVLNTYCSDLQTQDKDLEALTCYEKALNFYPQDSEILNELGSFFAKMERLFLVVRSHFKKHWRTIACQINAVNDNDNPKRAFLYDCGARNNDVLLNLVRELKKEKLIGEDVSIATVKDDIFILNLRKFRIKSSHVIVDVSGNLKLPRILDDTRSFITMFDDINKQLLFTDADEIISLKMNTDYCIPTIFGYLINYPVLYYHKPDDQDNCLSMMNLEVHQVITSDETLISFSVPSTIYDQNEVVQDRIAEWFQYFKDHENFSHKHDRDEEAKAFFEQACCNDQQNLLAYQNLQNIKNKMARWHFRMLNDSARNLSFKKGIQYWIRKERKYDVMDIGSGTGLLSIYAANVASVKSIYAIECSPIMAQISAEVFKENIRGKLVKLIMKHSMDLKVGEDDIPSKMSLIVSETLDSGVFGEGILDTLIHAKQHLLEPDGKIVPWKVKIHIVGYKSKSLTTNQVLLNESIKEYLFLDNTHIVARHNEPYDAEYVNKISDFKMVTNIVDTIEVDFNDLKSMQDHFNGSIVKEFELQSDVNNDYIDGFVTWFTLYLNEMDPENVISTEPGAGSCWTQALFKLRNRVLLKKHQVLKLSMSCKEGVLKVHHDVDVDPETTFLEVDPDVLRFLNDEEYLRELDYAVSQKDKTFINCLDLSPFPFAGMMLLKDKRLDKLWCRKQVKELITFVALKNLIALDRIVFVGETEIKLEMTFHVIIFHPLHPLGDLNGHFLSEYSTYRKMLSDDGLMIPYKLTLFGELINSDWLVNSCKITDIGVKRLKIDKFINEFATEVHLDLDSSVDCERLTGIFYISKIHFDNELHETSVEVPMRNINLPVHGILYHYRIKLTEAADEISTNRKSKDSCFKRTAQILLKECVINGATAKVLFTQNSGIVKCELINEK